ncbi:MAG: hypothetical protein AB9922_11225 [Bacteroidales bacterium]
MRRVVSLLFLLCASFTILVHSIIPHQHCNGIVLSSLLSGNKDHKSVIDHHHWINTGHTHSFNNDVDNQNLDDSHNCSDPNCSNGHNGDGDENCLLNSLLSKLVINEKEQCKIALPEIHSVPWIVISPELSVQIKVPDGITIKYYELLPSFYEVALNHPGGLRAPPLC